VGLERLEVLEQQDRLELAVGRVLQALWDLPGQLELPVYLVLQVCPVELEEWEVQEGPELLELAE